MVGVLRVLPLVASFSIPPPITRGMYLKRFYVSFGEGVLFLGIPVV
jgi:hypothetical protein